MKTREKYIDGIKVFALAMVFALHTQRGVLETDPCHNFAFFYFARCAMPLFFMVNGYLILSKTEFTFEYYKKKILNMIRLLLIWGIIGFFYYLILHGTSFMEAAKNGFKIFLAYHWVSNMWFFITFGILYTILLFAFQFVKKNIKTLTIIFGIICIIIDIISVVCIMKGGFFIQANVTQRLRLWTWCFYFMFGYIVGNIKIEDIKLFKTRHAAIITITTASIVLSVITIIWQYWLCWIKTGQIESNYVYDNIFIILWSLCLFLFFKYHRRISDYLAGFVKESFGAFLIHSFIIDYMNLRALPSNAIEAFLVWVLILVGTFALSHLLQKIPVVKYAFKY